MTADVILIDDEPHLLESVGQSLELAGLSVECHSSGDGALRNIGRLSRSIIVTDVRMPAVGGLDVMAAALAIDPQIPVILITGHGDVPMAVRAIRDGAYDFIEKPFASDHLVASVRRALEQRRLVLDNRALRDALTQTSSIERTLVGRDPKINRLRERIISFAEADADVLINGETGTGKEVVARALHDVSPRREGPFVAINCGALPAAIIESELFGHEAGAFTGAVRSRIGKFEYAAGGTLFLDEIESMPLDLQARLLRVLEQRSIVRLGSNQEIPIDVRVVAATKEDLREAGGRGTFREDLYYRVNVLTLAIPPLRERRNDIPLLFTHFLARCETRLKRKVASPGSMDYALLIAHDWPGNVRELENVATRFALGLGIDFAKSGGEAASNGSEQPSLVDQLATLEQLILRRTLAECGGSMRRCYERLGMSRKTLYDKLKKYGISTEDEHGDAPVDGD
jgi:two-component system C4-dicarboxylate transport response regulator DctD